MTGTAQLEAIADARLAKLERTLGALSGRTSLLGIADEVVAHAGGAPRVDEIIAVLKRNPLLALGLALLAGTLVVEVNKERKLRTVNGHRRRRIARVAPLKPSHPMEEPGHDA